MPERTSTVPVIRLGYGSESECDRMLRERFPTYRDLARSADGLVSYVRDAAGAVLGVLAPEMMFQWSPGLPTFLPLVRTYVGEPAKVVGERLHEALPGCSELSYGIAERKGLPSVVTHGPTGKIVGFLLYEDPPVAVASSGARETVPVMTLESSLDQVTRELALRAACPSYVDVVPSNSSIEFVRGAGGVLLAVLAPPSVVPVAELPLVRIASGVSRQELWDAIRAVVRGGRDLSIGGTPRLGIPAEIIDTNTRQTFGLLLWEDAPTAVVPPAPPSAPPETERSALPPRILALAMQLFFVQYDYAIRSRERRAPPGLWSVPDVWSQALALRCWGMLPEDQRVAWGRFAERLAVYAGHPTYTSGPVGPMRIGPMRIVPQLDKVRWMARCAESASQGIEPLPATWQYLETELGSSLLGMPWEALVRDVYRDAYEQAASRRSAAAAVLAAEGSVPPGAAPPMPVPASRTCYCNSQSCDAEHPNDLVRR